MEKRIEEIAKEVCNKYGIAIYSTTLINAAKGLIIAIYITKVNGVTINECTLISRNIAEILEEEDFIEDKYYLEVSSPGVERSLDQKKHYVSAIGEIVKVTYSLEDKNIKEIGVLKEVLPEVIKIEKDGNLLEIKLKDIKKARTHFDYKKEMKDKKQLGNI